MRYLGLCLALCACAPARRSALPLPEGNAQAPRGNVRVQASPPDAELSVDGVLQGLAQDFDGTRGALSLSSGPHRIQLRKDGYRAAELTVFATDEGIQSVNVALDKE